VLDFFHMNRLNGFDDGVVDGVVGGVVLILHGFADNDLALNTHGDTEQSSPSDSGKLVLSIPSNSLVLLIADALSIISISI
jgi:hypothetical protein